MAEDELEYYLSSSQSCLSHVTDFPFFIITALLYLARWVK
jgi:hypothetical protein